MAYEQSGFKMTMVAGADLSTHQFKLVRLSANNTVVLCSALTDIPCGVLQNSPVSGAAAEITVTGITKIKVGAAPITVPNLIQTDAAGTAIAADPDGTVDNYFIGQLVEGAGAAEIATALINCAVPVIQSGS